MKTRIMYVENKETGEARIGRVSFSRTFQTVYYHGKTLHLARVGSIKGNFYDAASGEEYWVSGPKKRDGDCHSASKVPVTIDEEIKEEYWAAIRSKKAKPASS